MRPAATGDCRALLGNKPSESVGLIEATELQAGRSLCVQTDERGIALVTISEVVLDDLQDLEELRISFTVWAD